MICKYVDEFCFWLHCLRFSLSLLPNLIFGYALSAVHIHTEFLWPQSVSVDPMMSKQKYKDEFINVGFTKATRAWRGEVSVGFMWEGRTKNSILELEDAIQGFTACLGL